MPTVSLPGMGARMLMRSALRGAGQVALQGHDLIHPHPLGRVNLVAGNGGAARDIPRRHGDAELREGIDENALGFLQFLGIGGLPAFVVHFLQQIDARQGVVFVGDRLFRRQLLLAVARGFAGDGRIDDLRRGPGGAVPKLPGFRFHLVLQIQRRRRGEGVFLAELALDLARLLSQLAAFDGELLAVVRARQFRGPAFRRP